MKPLNNKIQLDIKDIKIGAIQSDSIEEHGTIIAIGPLVPEKISVEVTDNPQVKNIVTEGFVIGKTLYFKAWAVDVISKDGVKYYFISADSDAICAIE